MIDHHKSFSRFFLLDNCRIPRTMVNVQAPRVRYEAAGSGRMFTYWDELSSKQQGQFAEQLEWVMSSAPTTRTPRLLRPM